MDFREMLLDLHFQIFEKKKNLDRVAAIERAIIEMKVKLSGVLM